MVCYQGYLPFPNFIVLCVDWDFHTSTFRCTLADPLPRPIHFPVQYTTEVKIEYAKNPVIAERH